MTKILVLVLLVLAAVAGIAPARAGDFTCPRPLVFPDTWNDTDGSGQWSVGDIYDPAVTGFQLPRDLGLALTVRPGQPPGVVPGLFFVIDFPPLGQGELPLTGGDWVAAWFSGCSPYLVAVDDSVQLEPGLTLSQVAAGVQAFLDDDPQASWDENSMSVVGSAFSESPRVMTVMAYDPSFPPISGRNFVKVRKLVKLFVESMDTGTVIHARIIDVRAAGTTPVHNVTWGRLKSRYR